MTEPEIVIVIQGGIVAAVASKQTGTKYRVIDLDIINVSDNEPLYRDYPFDAENINIEEYTKKILKDMKK